MAQFKVIPQLVSVHGAARPSGFYISNGSISNTIAVSPNTGQFYVMNASALNFELLPTYRLIVSARQRSFNSGCVC